MVIAFQTEEPGGEVAKLEAEAGSTFISLPHVLAMHDLRRAAVGGSSFFLRQEGSEMHESPARLDDCYEFSLSNRGTHTLGPGSVIPQVPGVVDTLKRSCRPEIVGAVVERIPILVVDNRRDGLEVDFPADSENHPVGEHFTATDNNHDSLLARFDRARDPTFMHGVDPNGGGLVPEMMGRPPLPKEAAGLHVQMETLHEERESDVGVSHSVSDFSHFTSLGDAAQAVVLRLQSKIPRLRVYGVRSVLNEGGSEDGSL